MKWFVGLLALILLYSEPAWAQGFSVKSLELNIALGESQYSSKSFQIGSPQSSTPINGEMKISARRREIGRLNFLTTNRIGTEGFYSLESTDVTFNRKTAPVTSLSIPMQIHAFGVNVLYYPIGKTEDAWRPFVSIGGGAMIYRPTGRGQSIATSPLYGNLTSFFESSRGSGSAGVGLKRSFSRSFGVRFDVEDTFTKAPNFGLPSTSTVPNASVLPVHGLSSNLQASVGVIVYLGR